MRLVAALLLAGLAAPAALAPAALAQPAGPVGPTGAPDTRRQGENWNMRQDLTHPENTTRPGSAQPSAEVRRAQRQAQQQRAITGTGRPVSQMPASTPATRDVPRSAPPRPAQPPRPAGAAPAGSAPAR